MYDLANVVQHVGRVKELVIEQKKQKTDISTHTVSK